MTTSTTNMHEEVARAMPAVLDVVSNASGQLYASEVIDRVHGSLGIRDEAVRHAIWRLISTKRLELTGDRQLAVASDETRESATSDRSSQAG